MNSLPSNELRKRALAETARRVQAYRTNPSRLCIQLRVSQSLHSRLVRGTPATSLALYSIRMLRVLRGLPDRLEFAEVQEVLSAINRWPTQHAAASDIGYTRQQISNLQLRKLEPSLKLWALFFPERIGCEDIIESPLRAKKGAR